MFAFNLARFVRSTPVVDGGHWDALRDGIAGVRMGPGPLCGLNVAGLGCVKSSQSWEADFSGKDGLNPTESEVRFGRIDGGPFAGYICGTHWHQTDRGPCRDWRGDSPSVRPRSSEMLELVRGGQTRRTRGILVGVGTNTATCFIGHNSSRPKRIKGALVGQGHLRGHLRLVSEISLCDQVRT